MSNNEIFRLHYVSLKMTFEAGYYTNFLRPIIIPIWTPSW
jgi:hypothetical protein